MASESIAHSAFSLMGYWLTAHSGSRNNICYNKFNTWDLWGASYVQPIITHFLATWPWRSNIRLDEIAKIATWVNTNQAEEHGLLLKNGKWPYLTFRLGTCIHIPPPPHPTTHTCPTLRQTYAWLCLISHCIFCSLFLYFCTEFLWQYNAMHKFVRALDNPPPIQEQTSQVSRFWGQSHGLTMRHKNLTVNRFTSRWNTLF